MAEGGTASDMKRIGNLWPEVTSFENLLAAALAASAGKRKRPDVAAFLLGLEPELLELRRQLLSREYRTGAYRTFTIHDPKPRKISAAPFRDRVVHHALTRVLEPIFEKRFSNNSFACRTGMGTHKALERAKEGTRRFRYALKCDVRKYFASIDHAILNAQLARTIKCAPTLDLAALIIEGFPPGADDSIRYFPGDDLFSPYERRRGLPLGNQTSQFFANVYLNGLDRLIDERLKPGVYVRYVDDFVLFDDRRARLREMRRAIVESMDTVRLEIHSGKSRIYRCADGVTFLGWRLFPRRTRLVRGNVIRFRRRMKEMRAAYAAGRMTWDDVGQRVQAWIAHASQGNTWVLRERLLSGFAFASGARPHSPRGVLQQQCEEAPRGEPQRERA
jgi:retron-type reverse transcriptase